MMIVLIMRMMIMMMMAHGFRNPGWRLCNLYPAKEMKRTVLFEFALEGAVALTISAVSKDYVGTIQVRYAEGHIWLYCNKECLFQTW